MEDINNINTEDFISEIEARPAIWELSSDDYTNKITKKNAWEEVIKKFCPDFERKSSAEKNNIALRFQRKWKSLRDCYSRELLKLKKERLGAVAPANRKQYMYYNQLSFLQTVVKPMSSIMETVDNLAKVVKKEPKKHTEIEVNVKSNMRSKRSISDMKQLEDDKLFMAVAEKIMRGKPQQTMEKDEDTLFVLSLVPELKKIPDDMKLDVKCELLNVFKKARLNQSFSSSASSPTTCSIPSSTFPYTDQCQFTQSFKHNNQSNVNINRSTTHTQTATYSYSQAQSPLSPSAHASPSPTSSQLSHSSQNSYIDFADNM
ncbi:hypothetical protein KPH14_003798 [Odynerus spinipes]|uniref:MADF domain-containing protein n=1 Tax=Odynerus spinipes TaxID=1348599 RepID=A0AAD9RXF3_9HYME|nr:hypothetical protein KPH14_003798 [Odynerus spinipes]